MAHEKGNQLSGWPSARIRELWELKTESYLASKFLVNLRKGSLWETLVTKKQSQIIETPNDETLPKQLQEL